MTRSGVLLASLVALGCGTARTPSSGGGQPERHAPVSGRTTPGHCAPRACAEGMASYYADHFEGRRTASGESYRRAELTGAHRKVPFGTRVRVVRVDDGRFVEVRINDRGPYGKGRVIDLSRAAAEALGMMERGVVRVRIEPLSSPAIEAALGEADED
jgi:rare lipoprotein A